MRFNKPTILLTIAVMAVVFLSSSLSAADAKMYRIKRVAATPASDLHVVFTGTGGVISVAVLNDIPGCSEATVSTPGGDLDLTWSSACVDLNEFVLIRVTTPNGPLAFSSGYWTNGPSQPSPGIGLVAPTDIAEVASLPSMTPLGLIVLAALMIGAGIWFFYRRRSAPNPVG